MPLSQLLLASTEEIALEPAPWMINEWASSGKLPEQKPLWFQSLFTSPLWGLGPHSTFSSEQAAAGRVIRRSHNVGEEEQQEHQL